MNNHNQQQPPVNVAESTVLECLARLPRIRVHARTATCDTIQRLKIEGRLTVKQDREGRWWIKRIEVKQ